MLPGRVFVSLLVVVLLLLQLQLALVSAAALQEPVVLRSADSVWGVTLEVRSARFDRDGVAFNTRLFCHATHAHTRGPTERCWSCPRRRTPVSLYPSDFSCLCLIRFVLFYCCCMGACMGANARAQVCHLRAPSPVRPSR